MMPKHVRAIWRVTVHIIGALSGVMNEKFNLTVEVSIINKY
jgi:hypothetical protein